MRFLALVALAAGLAGLRLWRRPKARLDAADAAMPSRAAVEPRPSSSCSPARAAPPVPTADAVLGRLAKRDDVIALSLSVDYWDYLGWKDTLASPKFSERQRAYAKARGDGMIYTPQVVVNGLVHVNGSDEGKIERLIDKTAKTLSASRVPITAVAGQGQAGGRGRRGAARDDAARKPRCGWP